MVYTVTSFLYFIWKNIHRCIVLKVSCNRKQQEQNKTKNNKIHASHDAFKYKFYVENYKKCISCELHRTQSFHWMLYSYLFIIRVCVCYVFMAIWWLMCIHIYACLFTLYANSTTTKKVNKKISNTKHKNEIIRTYLYAIVELKCYDELDMNVYRKIFTQML